MKVALVQMDSRDNKEANIQKALTFCRQAFENGAKLVLLPEYFYWRGCLRSSKEVLQVAEGLSGPTVKAFAALAMEFQAHCLLGSICERSRDGKNVYNTAVLLGPQGKILSSYRKRHLFKMRIGKRQVDESRAFKSGKGLSVTSVGSFKLGIAVCFDLRFPDIFEASARLGANLFAVPASFSFETGKAHWEVLLRARAIETFSYVLAVGQTGENVQGALSWGNSMVIDPWGKIVVQASRDKEEILYAQLSLGLVRKIRSRFVGYKGFKEI